MMDALVTKNPTLLDQLKSNQVPAESVSALVELEQNKHMVYVKMAISAAHAKPRDQHRAFTNIIEACKRKSFAEDAMYAYPRGPQLVTGPSIRMAEMLVQCWGNIKVETMELARHEEHSEVSVVAWDLETNYMDSKSFIVPHVIDTKSGPKKTRDQRDIDELIFNKASRRRRASILAVIPGDIVDAAVLQCEKTLASGGEGPISDRVRLMVSAFKEIGVTQENLEKRLGHNIDVTIETEMVTLKKIYKSLKDGMVRREDLFDISSGKANDINETLDALVQK